MNCRQQVQLQSGWDLIKRWSFTQSGICLRQNALSALSPLSCTDEWLHDTSHEISPYRETQTHCYHISITIAGTFSPPRKPPPALANEMLMYDKWLSDQMWLKFSPVGEQSSDYLHWIYGIQIITQIVRKKLAVPVMINTKLNIHSSCFLKKRINWGYSAVPCCINHLKCNFPSSSSLCFP